MARGTVTAEGEGPEGAGRGQQTGTGHTGLLSQGRWQPRPEKDRGQAPECCQRQREEASSQEGETAEPRGSRGQRDRRGVDEGSAGQACGMKGVPGGGAGHGAGKQRC